MKLSDFILLSEEGKKQAVLNEGVLISKRAAPSSFIFLFQVQKFYVEACFSLETKDIEEFRMFNHPGLLEPYLEAISLDGLLN